jgi:hypothetical protein
MKITALLLGLTLFVLKSKESKAQNQPSDIGLMYDYGFILKHSQKIGHLQSHPQAFTLYYNRYLNGSKDWHQTFKYPKTSFAFTYFDYQNPIIGQSLALSANMLIPFYKKPKHNAEWKIGTGLVYATNPFDLQNNFRNNVLSNRWSYVMQTGFSWGYQWNAHWQSKIALQLTHYSNGAYKLPNAGVNVVTAALATQYTFAPEKNIQQEVLLDTFSRRWHLQTALAGSLIETEINQPRKHIVVNLGFLAARDINRRHRFLTGLEVSWNEGIKYQIDRKFADSTSKPDYRRVGWVIGDEIIFGKMSLNIQFGVYLRRQFEALTDMGVYQRYGLKYYFLENFWAGLLLKTHAATAEAAEFTIGTTWKLRQKE